MPKKSRKERKWEQRTEGTNRTQVVVGSINLHLSIIMLNVKRTFQLKQKYSDCIKKTHLYAAYKDITQM